MPVATSRFETEKASRYLQQLCKHFAHKVDCEWSETEGTADLPGGRLTLTASATALAIHVTGEDAKGLTKARYVLEDHLVRFAFREGLLGLHWEFAPDDA